MPERNDQELKTFGFIKNWMRSGLITAILSLQTIAIIYLFMQNSKLNDRLVEKQDELYRRTIEYLREPVQKMNNAAEKVDTISTKVDSVTTQLMQKGGSTK